MITLTPKPAKFSAAHSLPCLGLPCSRKHGHTWIVYATFRGEPNADGVLVPYEIVRDAVAPLDHQDLDEILVVPATGENLARLLAESLTLAIGAGGWSAELVRVELHEDPAPVPHVIRWEPQA
jgi:6-pyruvoyl-tetrahydropterin synthase